MDIQINKNLMHRNITEKKRTKNDIQWIVVHYVGALGDAKANTDYYKNTYVGASADFFVGHTGDIWQANDYFSAYSWHCGGGLQSSWRDNDGAKYYKKCTNSNSVGIEMCVHKKSTATMNATDKDWYFERATILSTAKLIAYLMNQLSIDINHVIMHYNVTAKICPAPWVVPDSIGGGIDGFTELKKMAAAFAIDATLKESEKEVKWYRVGTAWVKGKCVNQIGAYQSVANAKTYCPPGYKVFNDAGKCVYSEKSVGIVAADFTGLTESEAAAKILEIARAEGKRAHILPSVIAAQCILESGYCKGTELVRKANNCFGMKTLLSGNNWNSVWDGKSSVTILTKEEYSVGHISTISASFRVYPSIEKSFEDHSCYLLGAMNGAKKRYEGLTECTNYREAASLIKNGGYATDSKYIAKLCSIIERYDLDVYDAEVTTLTPVVPETTTLADAWYRVGTDWIDGKCINQIGAYIDLEMAKTACDENDGYLVYDYSGKVVYGEKVKKKIKTYVVQIGAYKLKGNASRMLTRVKSLGFEAFMIFSENLYRVQCGSFRSKLNAEKMVRTLQDNGFKPCIKEIES